MRLKTGKPPEASTFLTLNLPSVPKSSSCNSADIDKHALLYKVLFWGWIQSWRRPKPFAERHTEITTTIGPFAPQALRPPPQWVAWSSASSGNLATPGLRHRPCMALGCPLHCLSLAAPSSPPANPGGACLGLTLLAPQGWSLHFFVWCLCSYLILSPFSFPGSDIWPIDPPLVKPDSGLFPIFLPHFHTSPVFAQDVPPPAKPFFQSLVLKLLKNRPILLA